MSTPLGSGASSSGRLVGVASGVETGLVDEGPRGDTAVGGVAIVLLHGTPVDADVWDSLADVLARRRVVRFDARGPGAHRCCGWRLFAAGADVLDVPDLVPHHVSLVAEAMPSGTSHVPLQRQEEIVRLRLRTPVTQAAA